MHIQFLSKTRYMHTMLWAIASSCVIVALAALLAKATLNLTAALTDKPDIALYLLLPEEEIGHSELLRDEKDQRDYLADTKEGPKLIRLKRGPHQWYVSFEEDLHE